MKYCKRCLQPDTRPNSYFKDDGVCPACHYYFEVSSVADWDERLEDIQDFLKQYQRKPGQQFDCMIGVSGGKDSTRQALWVRDKLGMKPLLVCLTYPPEQVTERGVDNLSNLINLGFDVVVSALSPQTWRRTLERVSIILPTGQRPQSRPLLARYPRWPFATISPLYFGARILGCNWVI
jgi:hypothetical protein